MEQKLRDFIDAHVAKIKPIARELYDLHWQFDTTGDDSLVPKKEELEKRYLQVYSEQESFAQLQAMQKSSDIADPLMQRQLQCLFNAFTMHQWSGKYVDKVVKLESEISSIYNQFRGKIDGKPHNDNEIAKILHKQDDQRLRQKAWEASKQIGAEVAEKVLQLVRIRNLGARESGYRDYYNMALTHKELNEEKMFATLGRLAELTDEPFRERKRQLDEEKSKRFGIGIDELRPWHYGDPFFQQVPPRGGLELDELYKDADIEALTTKTFDSIGMDIRDILARSDLYPKDKKCQHAYCTAVDQQARDIRILCNIDQSERWMGTTLHEFGHGVYDKYTSTDLPYLLDGPAHTLSTEAIAMMMDTLSKNPGWLTDILQTERDKVERIKDQLIDTEVLGQFIFVRWGLVMVHFEKEMYHDPEQDLNTLWWDLVEKFQYIPRPDNRHAPDWAAKIHLALCPVYYQNYLYGELVSAQLQHYIRNNVGNGQLYNNDELGEYLIKKYFHSGASYDWNETLARATGEELKPEYFVTESLRIAL